MFNLFKRKPKEIKGICLHCGVKMTRKEFEEHQKKVKWPERIIISNNKFWQPTIPCQFKNAFTGERLSEDCPICRKERG